MTGVVIGVRSTGADLVVPGPSGDSKHVLVGGQTGGGKSMIVKAFMGGIAGRPDVAVIGLDPKRTALGAWEPRLTVLAKTVRECTHALIQVWQEVQRRALVMDAAGVGEWSPRLGGPFLVLLIDELVEVVAIDPDLFADALITTATSAPSTPAFEAETKTLRAALQTAGTSQKGQGAFLTSLARVCRSAGVQIIAATQHPDASVIDTQFRSNMTVRIMMRVASQEAVSVVLGAGQEAEITPDSISVNERGGCWVVGIGGRPVRGRGFWVKPERERACAAATARFRWPADRVFTQQTTTATTATTTRNTPSTNTGGTSSADTGAVSSNSSGKAASKPQVMFMNGARS